MIEIWTCCKKAAQTVVGTLIANRNLSESWTGFTQFTISNEKLPDGKMWSGSGLQKFRQQQGLIFLWPEIWSGMSNAAQRKEKQQWSMDKPKFDDALQLRDVSLIDPDDKEFKETMKNAWKELDLPFGSSHARRDRLVANPTTEGRVVFRKDIVKNDSGSSRCVHTARFVCISNDGRNSNGCQCKAIRLRRTSSRRSNCLHRSENERRSKITEASNVTIPNMSRYLVTSFTTQVAQILVQY